MDTLKASPIRSALALARQAALLLVLACLLPLASAPAFAQDRLALVIGIDAYREVQPLVKAKADARAVGEMVARAGFKVDLVLDADRRELNRAFAEFLGKIRPGAIVFFHFSGHGVEIEGNSYLLPADIPKPRAGDQEFVKREAMRLSEVIESFSNANAQTRILIVDACRDNPFAAKGVRSVGASRGIAILPVPKGSFVIYSASSQQTALDRLGDADNEPTAVFTRVFLKHAAVPGRSIVTVARGLRDEVEELARGVGHQQRPAYYDELSGEFALFGASAAPPQPAPIAQPNPGPPNPPPPPAPQPTADCRVLYWQARQVGTCAAYDAVAKACTAAPEGRFASEIVRRDCAPPARPRVAAARLYSVPADISDGYLNLRAGPGVGNAALARIPAGESGLALVNCVPADDGGARLWCRVNWRGLAGYVSSCCIVNAATGAPPPGAQPRQPQPAVSVGVYSVTRNLSDGFLQLRSGPGRGHAPITRIPAGATGVSVLSCRGADDGGRNPWCAVRWQGFSGWVSNCCIVDANGAKPQ